MFYTLTVLNPLPARNKFLTGAIWFPFQYNLSTIVISLLGVACENPVAFALWFKPSLHVRPLRYSSLNLQSDHEENAVLDFCVICYTCRGTLRHQDFQSNVNWRYKVVKFYIDRWLSLYLMWEFFGLFYILVQCYQIFFQAKSCQILKRQVIFY